MMLIALLLQAAAPATACPNPDALPAAAARGRCAGVALADAQRWREAAGAFETAAKLVNSAKAADLWAQAGNAWLAAGEPAKAGAALDAALVWSAGRSEFDKGELRLDRARAAVAAGDLDAGRTVLDQALAAVPGDPLAWLLSATLARRTGDLPRAQTDIAQALKLSSDDASVQLEAGNIAASGGDADGAKAAWQAAIRLAPASPAGQYARTALAQFDAPAAAAATPAPSK